MSERHIKFAAELGVLVARAKFAALNPQLEQELGIWANTNAKRKAMLLGKHVQGEVSGVSSKDSARSSDGMSPSPVADPASGGSGLPH